MYPTFRGLIVCVAIGLLVLAVSGVLLVSRTGFVRVYDSQQPPIIVAINLSHGTVNENESNKYTISTAGSKSDILHETTTPVEEPIKIVVEQFENKPASQLKRRVQQVEGLRLKQFYDTVQQPRSVFTLYEGLKQKIECMAKPSFSGVSSDKSQASAGVPDPGSADGCLFDDETCVSVLPPVFLRNEKGLSNQTQKHVFLNPYQTKMFLSSEIISERDSHKNKTPRVIHFVFVSKGTFHFSLGLYLAIRAAFLRVVPDAIYFHTYHVPNGCPYYRLSEPMITKVIIHKPVTQIFGRPVKVIEHVTDVIRLRALLKYGGIYIDGDIISLRSFDKFIYHSKNMTMGTETEWSIRDHVPAAVMIGRRKNPFLDRWIQGYKNFIDSKWGESSVLQPARLAKKYPEEINLETRYTFYYPYVGKESIDVFFNSNDMQSLLGNRSYTVHFWSHRNKQYLTPLTPSSIFNCDIGINEILRPLLPNPFISFAITIENHRSDFELKLIQSLIGIAQQSFPLWEVLVNITDATDKLAYQSGNVKLRFPYYSCDLNALVGSEKNDDIIDKFSNELGARMKGSAFSKFRCGKLKLEQDIPLSSPPTVNDEDESGTTPIPLPRFVSYTDKHEWIKPRGAWLVNLRLGEVLSPDFLHQAFEAMRIDYASENVTASYQNSDKEQINKEVKFVFGRS